MGILKSLVKSTPSRVFNVLKSPKTIAALKLAAAGLALVHAIDEFRDASKSAKKKIGFSSDEE